jgi:pyruvate kinase
MGVSEGIAQAGARLAIELGARALVALTRSGASARQLARFPLRMPIYAYTPSKTTLTKMTLYRGVLPRPIPEQKGLERAIRKIEEDLRARRDVRRGDRLVMMGGAPDEPMGTTNRLIVHDVR